jgi:Mg2+/Co2+ transporter CorB
LDDLSTGLLFGTLALLIALSAFFSGSETALMSLNRYRLRHLKEKGHKGAEKASLLLSRPDRLIGLILLGNNFVNILASSISTLLAIRLGGNTAIAISTGLLTLVILIFAEVTPKTLAALHPERVAFPAAHIYKPLLRLLYPLVWIVNWMGNNLLRLLGVDYAHRSRDALSQEELRIVLNEAGALIPELHQRMLISILDLEKAQIEDIMVPRNEVTLIDLKDPLDEIIEQIQEVHYSLVPLVDGGIDEVVGMLPLRGAARLLANGGLHKESLREIAQTPYYIPEGTPLNQQLLNFQRFKRRTGLVVDEYGDLLGLVTLVDLLEEIVGEFTTDPLDSLPNVHPQEDGSFLVEGSASVRDLKRKMDWPLPTDGPKTLNGLILEYMETIPEPGTSLRLAGLPIEIMQTSGHTVKMVRIRTDLKNSETESKKGSN